MKFKIELGDTAGMRSMLAEIGEKLVDDETIAEPCPQCGKQLSATVRELRTSEALKCDCGGTVNVKIEKVA